MKQVLFFVLYSIFIQIKSYADICSENHSNYVSIEKDNKKQIFINPDSNKGFYIQSDSKNRPNHVGFPFIKSVNESNRSAPSITFLNPNLGKMMLVKAKTLNLYNFDVPPNCFHPYYYLSTARISGKNQCKALYLVDHYKSTVTPFIEKGTHFYPPIFNENSLYYGFANKNKKSHIYRVCSKEKKIQVFPTGFSRIDKWSISDSGKKIIGYGKINQSTAFFIFDTITFKIQILNLLKIKNSADFHIDGLDFSDFIYRFRNFCFINKDLYMDNVKFFYATQQNRKEIFSWDTKKNQIQSMYTVPDQPFYQPTVSFYDNGINYVYIKGKTLWAIRLNKSPSLVQTLSLPNVVTGYISCSQNKAGTKIFIRVSQKKPYPYMSLSVDSKEGRADFYFADFEKNLIQPIQGITQASAWKKDTLWGFNGHTISKLNYSSLKSKTYPWNLAPFTFIPRLPYPSSMDKFLYGTDNILALTNRKKLCWFNPQNLEVKQVPFVIYSSIYENRIPINVIYGFLKPDYALEKNSSNYLFDFKSLEEFVPNPKQGILGKINVKSGTAFLLKAPSLENIFIKEFQLCDKYRTYTDKLGFHLLEFDVDKESLLQYIIPNQKPNYVDKTKNHIIFSHNEKHNLWVWIIDTEKQLLTTLKFPEKLPIGYFDLKKYMVKQTLVTQIPDQKWEEVPLK